jgi:hypothetical protein
MRIGIPVCRGLAVAAAYDLSFGAHYLGSGPVAYVSAYLLILGAGCLGWPKPHPRRETRRLVSVARAPARSEALEVLHAAAWSVEPNGDRFDLTMRVYPN